MMFLQSEPIGVGASFVFVSSKG